MPILQCKSLFTGYAETGKTLLTSFNMEFETGELVMLAGRNGSGKSTLLHCLAGLQNPIAGKVVINNNVLHEMTAEDRCQFVSIMFSTPPVLEYVPVKDVVLTSMSGRFSPFKTDFSAEYNEVFRVLDLCGILALANRHFHTLSDGEKQKTMLARSLAQNTPVILLDEPLAFLDYPSRIQMLELLKNLSVESQKLIIISSHDLDISLPFANSLILLEVAGNYKTFKGKSEIENISAKSLFT